MKHFSVSLLFCLFIVNTAFADSKAPNYYSTAKQHEANGNLGSAANDYGYAAGQTDNLSQRAEIYCDSVRVFLKSNNYRGAVEQMLQVKHNDPKRVISLLAKYEPQARAALLSSVSNNRSFGFPQEGMRNEEISYFHQFFPKSREALAEDFYKKAVEENAGYWYDLAAQTSEKVAAKIVARFMGDVSKLSIQQKAERLKTAGKYISDFKIREKYANELLPEGKRLAVIPGEENKTTEIRLALVELMGQSWVDDINHLPETVLFPLGQTIIEIQSGEQTPYWIGFQGDRPISCKISGNRDADYVRVYNDGRIMQKTEKHSGSLSRHKVVASKYTKLWYDVK